MKAFSKLFIVYTISILLFCFSNTQIFTAGANNSKKTQSKESKQVVSTKSDEKYKNKKQSSSKEGNNSEKAQKKAVSPQSSGSKKSSSSSEKGKKVTNKPNLKQNEKNTKPKTVASVDSPKSKSSASQESEKSSEDFTDDLEIVIDDKDKTKGFSNIQDNLQSSGLLNDCNILKTAGITFVCLSIIGTLISLYKLTQRSKKNKNFPKRQQRGAHFSK